MFINYAHRGASSYAPENTMSAFDLGVRMGANGIETDVRMTKDGVPVLFHDNTLARMTGCEGACSDYMYAELLCMPIRHPENGSTDVIVRFEDFLKKFGRSELMLAIELKDDGIEEEVLGLLDAYATRERTVITSFHMEYLERVRELSPSYRIGWLAKDFDGEMLERMKSCNGEQLCPKAENITAEKVDAWHKLGYSVRAWGVTTPELMRYAYDCGVDGMTVNFPDLLSEYINKQ
ncbi:MAG: hypothetical protein IJ011_01970 [Clostridia bacterium]|nr:hypothetical protein [Clostridia bacterium]